MQKIVKESEYLVAWLLLWLGATIFWAAAGFLAGLVCGAAGVDPGAVKLVKLMSGVLGAIVSYVLFRWIVGSMIVKKAELRIRGLSRDSANSSSGRDVSPAVETSQDTIASREASPDFRLKDNLLQAMLIGVTVIICALVGLSITTERIGGAILGAIVGLILGLSLSGIGLMIYRAMRHTRVK